MTQNFLLQNQTIVVDSTSVRSVIVNVGLTLDLRGVASVDPKSTSRHNHWNRTFVGSLVALFAYILVATPHARAECGDYIVLGQERQNNIKHLPASPASADPLHDPLKRSGPCHGPHCSQNPQAPPAPPSASSLGQQEWGDLASLILFTDHDVRRFTDQGNAGERSAFLHSVFHPPR
jgi:hypothetical protein